MFRMESARIQIVDIETLIVLVRTVVKSHQKIARDGRNQK